MLEQNMHVCTVCAAEQSAGRHYMLKHNGKMNLPMSTGCINYMDKSWTLNTGSEDIATTQVQEPNPLKRQARTIPWTSMDQSRTLGEHCEKEENQYGLYHTKLIPDGTEWTISNQLHK